MLQLPLHKHNHLEHVAFLGLCVLSLGTILGLTVSLVAIFLVLVIAGADDIDSQTIGTCLSPLYWKSKIMGNDISRLKLTWDIRSITTIATK